MSTFLIVLAISATLLVVGVALINSTAGKITGLVSLTLILLGGGFFGIKYTNNVLNKTLGEPKVTYKKCGALDYLKQGIKSTGEAIKDAVEEMDKKPTNNSNNTGK
jgi:hypothetical protein